MPLQPAIGSVDYLDGSGFPDNVLGIVVITQPDEDCVSQMVGSRPLSNFNLHDASGLIRGSLRQVRMT
jgi:hypothetical protein